MKRGVEFKALAVELESLVKNFELSINKNDLDDYNRIKGRILDIQKEITENDN